MNSNEYNKYILLNCPQSIYKNKMTRYLGIYTTPTKIKQFIENKTKKIYLDYEVYNPIGWNKDKLKLVKINKNKKITFSEYQISHPNQGFLTDIPYSLALSLYDIYSQQNLIKFEFNDWLNFVSLRFFNIEIKNKLNNINLLVDSLFLKDIVNHPYYKLINKDTISSFSNDLIQSFVFDNGDSKLFFFKYMQRFYLFEIK